MRDWSELTDDIEAVGTPDDADPAHDPTNGRWFEGQVADALGRWGYRTARTEYLFGLETDVIGRQDVLRGESADFLVVECKDEESDFEKWNLLIVISWSLDTPHFVCSRIWSPQEILLLGSHE